MLSQAARPYIEASVPVLREHGVAITRVFYANMFAAHPELGNLFNLGNQASGVQQQSLAAAVFAYAANIDNPAALAPVAGRIVHKHVSVGIKPGHYTIVGRFLLGAIKEVLGDAASPALMAAWDEAYWLLAGDLIAAEARLSQERGVATGELRPLKVIDTRRECNGVISYYLQTPEGKSPGAFLPGQYVSVAVDLPELGLRQLRQYSLSDTPERAWWRLSVKQEPGDAGTPAGAVSSWLHANLRAGDLLQVGHAFGDFAPVLDGQRPIALLSAGVGITPMIATLNALAERGDTRPILFAHATRDAQHHALRDDLAAARTRLPQLKTALFYEALAEDQANERVHAGRMTLDALLDERFADADFYLCGPIGFMRAQWQALLERGVAPERIQREVFGPELLDHLL